MAVSQTTDEAARLAEKVYVRQRLARLEEKIKDEISYRDFGASSEVDFKMSKARIDGYRTEIEALEDLLDSL